MFVQESPVGSQKSRHKASKGTVQIKTSNERLQLVFSFGGKRHYLSTGFTDTKANRKLAEMKAKQIELDILCNNFDITLVRYKPESQQAIFTPSAHSEKSPVEPSPESYASLADLWDSYTEYKRSSLSPSTLAKDYKKIYRLINVHLPVKTLDKAVAIRDWLIANRSPLSAKKILTQFSACCNWAVKSQLIEDNPFADMASDIKVRHGNSEETDINPFNVEERDRILEAFKENRYYTHYAPFIEFLFMTGCRPSEAVGLQWKHISNDFTQIRFEQAVVISESGLTCKPGLKTQRKRVFPINNRLAIFLKSIQPADVSGETKVFPSPEGKWIDVQNVSRRAWKTVLSMLDGVEYRKLYQTRHTFITMALKNGVDVKDLAKMVGNSPEIIYRHYAGQSREIFLPEF
ncbi:tyrosine-type recombinase/integrase [Rivularia sp. UHCC 0363]|uniref:tyrosine-type recombinase/integrase n=1 Tax=Rivularia sp. UHCC 0363 TaxID=3110244 RepID=UPI003A5996E6